jgi:DNA-binding winged helix-turn-helix (wHTH) protein
MYKVVRTGMGETPFQLGSVSVFPDRNQLLVNGKETNRQNKTLQVPVALVEAHPQTCSREVLIDKAWDGNHYSGEIALTNAIYKLRESGLSDIIKTVTKQGYCLTVAPQALSLDGSADQSHGSRVKRTEKKISTDYHLFDFNHNYWNHLLADMGGEFCPGRGGITPMGQDAERSTGATT